MAHATSYAGIDYGLGQSNVDKANGIRYGVISQHSVIPEAMDDVDYDYGKPTCPKCGNEVDAVPTHTVQHADGVSVISETGRTTQSTDARIMRAPRANIFWTPAKYSPMNQWAGRMSGKVISSRIA